MITRRHLVAALGISLMHALGVVSAAAGDQPQWGEAWSRNMVSTERGLPATFDPATGANLKWVIDIGTETHSTPVIAGGRIYLGTNNGKPRDPKHKGDRGVLMCLDEATGEFLWQLVVPKREEDIYFDWPNSGISSPATVEGDRVYIVSNRGEVMCLDALGMTNGNGGVFQEEGRHMTRQVPGTPEAKRVTDLHPGPMDADILWLFDLTSGAGIWSHDGAHSSILVRGDHLYLNTGTGVDNTHRKIRTPDAPSLVVLDKHTGKLLARERENIAPFIFHSTWASASMAKLGNRELLFFCAGNGKVYAFEPLPAEFRPLGNHPETLKKVWEFDFDPTSPKTNVHEFITNRKESPSNMFGMPVFYRGRIYVAGGGDIWWGKNQAWLKCIDPRGSGDITTNALVWTYPLKQHVMATPAIHDNIVYIADCGRTFHAVDAQNGNSLWTHEVRGEVWSSAYVADGKVWLGTRSGILYVFAAGRVKQKLLELELGKPISATPVAANGVIYIATMSQLYAVASH
jgi:outer membrane protein assembly factor BamB